MKRWLLMLSLTAIVGASCAPFSGELMRQVDESMTFGQIQKNPQTYQGKIVLWGGVIIETLNRLEETVVQVRQAELDLEKRPTNPDRSEGRFLVRSPGFLDPVIYQSGREITVAGELAGKEVLPLGEIQYSYPVVSATTIEL